MGIILHLARRLRARFHRDRLDDRLAEEIRLHIELRTRALTDEGMDPAEAAREATAPPCAGAGPWPTH